MTVEADTMRKIMVLLEKMNKDQLVQVSEHARACYKLQRQLDNGRRFLELKVNDRVKLGNTLRPQYLRGLTGVITGRQQTRLIVSLDRGPVGKYKSGSIIIEPASLEKIEMEATI